MTDVFLYSGETSPKDVKLRDPSQVSGKQVYTLTCSTGTYLLSGVVATLTYTAGASKVDYVLVCSTGIYSLTGVASTLKVVHTLVCSSGSYSLSGVAASLKLAIKLPCATGVYNYSGVDTTSLKVSHSLICDKGTYGYSGVASVLRRVSSLLCSTGQYTLAGNIATLTYSGTLPVTSSYLYNISDYEVIVYDYIPITTTIYFDLDNSRLLNKVGSTNLYIKLN